MCWSGATVSKDTKAGMITSLWAHIWQAITSDVMILKTHCTLPRYDIYHDIWKTNTNDDLKKKLFFIND